MARHSKQAEEFNWLDDPFDAAKERQVQEEIRSVKQNNGCALGAVALILAVAGCIAAFVVGNTLLLFGGIFLAGVGTGAGLATLLTR